MKKTMKTNEEVASNFSEETLNEMAMEDLEGGTIIQYEAKVNNCKTGNCSPGCGVNNPEESF